MSSLSQGVLTEQQVVTSCLVGNESCKSCSRQYALCINSVAAALCFPSLQHHKEC